MCCNICCDSTPSGAENRSKVGTVKLSAFKLTGEAAAYQLSLSSQQQLRHVTCPHRVEKMPGKGKLIL